MAAALEATASAGAGFDSLAAQTQRGLADRGDLTGRLLLDLDLSRRSTAETTRLPTPKEAPKRPKTVAEP